MAPMGTETQRVCKPLNPSVSNGLQSQNLGHFSIIVFPSGKKTQISGSMVPSVQSRTLFLPLYWVSQTRDVQVDCGYSFCLIMKICFPLFMKLLPNCSRLSCV